MVELQSHLATERAGLETLQLRVRAPVPPNEAMETDNQWLDSR